MTGERQRRVVYSVHGYGRGHAARAQAVLPELSRRYEMLVLAGDDAYDQLCSDYPVVRIPTLRYHHGRGNRRSRWLTIKRNIPAVLDLSLGGPIFQMLRDSIERFAPDVVISDSEAWSHRAAAALGVGRISFDHYGIMAHCRLPMSAWDRCVCRMESLVYRWLTHKPDRIIVAAFYEGPPRRSGVRVVGAILRELVRRTAAEDGEHLLVYFSNAGVHFTPRVEQALRALDCPVKVYGLGEARVGREGNIDFCLSGNEPFVRDLAGCRAVFATAGNQLISEAIHFGKPLLVLPERSLEQRLNARYVQEWKIGMQTSQRQISADQLKTFLGRCSEYVANLHSRRRDGLAEALDAIEKAIEELSKRSSGS